MTRVKAGRRGAAALDIEHLVEAIVIEDQGDMAKALGISDNEFLIPVGDPGLKPSHAFFSRDVASEVLLKLGQAFPQAEPIPTSTDMPLSPALKRIFDAALALTKELGQKEVGPLHLLAAVLSEPSSKAAEFLKDAGVTREAVISAVGASELDDHA